jgi:hypothetical protein
MIPELRLRAYAPLTAASPGVRSSSNLELGADLLIPVPSNTQTNTGMPAIPPAGLRKPSKLSKRSMISRRAAAIRGSGYLDICNTRFSEATGRLRECQHTWVKERLADDVRFRGIGCSERKICPVCGSYVQNVLAREASESMINAQTYFDIVGDELKSLGLKVILSIPKTQSQLIDGLLWTDEIAWTENITSFIRLGEKFVKRWFGDGSGANVALHLTGESDPGEPNYHLNFFVFPAAVEGSKFKILDRWYDVSKLRVSWTGLVNRQFGINLANADIKLQYLNTPAKLRHWMNYEYRHLLDDLWKGWRGVDGDVVHYVYGHGKHKDLARASVEKALERVYRIPAHFKRIRWFGIFSDGQRSKTMEKLWLEPEDIEDDNEPEWQVEKYYHLVRYEESGITLKDCLTGEECFVPESQLEYRPKGVSIGKRKKWHEPGWRTLGQVLKWPAGSLAPVMVGT